jgi:D-3-phosphoglycerate dehydrogenase / 2-oxoglutarate reductase
MKKVYITTSSFATFSNEPLELLDKNGISFELNDRGRKLTPEEVKSSLQKYAGVIAGTELYTKENLSQLPNLKVISRLGVGMDNIDLAYAEKQGLKVYKTKTTPALAVAELTLGFILDLLRKINVQNNQLKTGVWNKQMGELLTGKTLGIAGLGNIGKELVKILKGFNLNIIAHDLYRDESFAKKYNVQYVELDTLLKHSDIVSLHLNLTDETNKLFNYTTFKKMKKNAVLINASRGEIINETDLIKALDEKLIQGAGLDVFENEPYNGPLVNYENVILTPHIGAYAKEIRMKMELESVENLIEGFKNG